MYGPTPPVPPSVPPSARPVSSYPPPHPAYPAYPGTPTAFGGYLDHLGPAAPRRPITAARVGLFVLRALLACVPVGTLGMLSWVPLIRTALVRRRAWDWVALAVTTLLSFGAFVTVGTAPNEDDLQMDIGMATLLLLAAGSTVYFLVAELRRPPVPFPRPYGHPYTPPPYAPAPYAPPYAPPIVPLGQVQAELDELSALLHSHERSAP
jgi:hypothetical protein